MNSRADKIYAAWRERERGVDRLGEERGAPPEKLLQAIWQQQRIRRDQLVTADGRRVRVFHPGFVSREGGPDFRGAVLQLGDAGPVSGDVEVDLSPGGWHAHGHDVNPAFAKVLLRVVWAAGGAAAGAAGLPMLPLSGRLDAPLTELAASLEQAGGLPEGLQGKCAAPLRELSGARLAELLRAAARVRLRHKAEAILARARQAGWESALWEFLFRALGYKHNVWPMRCLAETRERWGNGARSVFEFQARLLGVGGLLPDELTRTQKSTDTYLRRAWDVWWRERDALADARLPRAAWRFHGLRPANHPQRRLALAAHWLADPRFIARLEAWGAAPAFSRRAAGPVEPVESNVRAMVEALRQILPEGADDEFWSSHWTLKSARLAKPQPLLGVARVTDLAVNVILPWLWIRAREGGNDALQDALEQRYFDWPAAEDNAVLKLARQRLLGTVRAMPLHRAAEQQGLLQIVGDFCQQSNAICTDCRFPSLVSGFCALEADAPAPFAGRTAENPAVEATAKAAPDGGSR